MEMLALKKTAPEPGLSLIDTPEPVIMQPDEVLVAVAAVGVCGSDVHVYEWTAGYDFMRSKLPVTLGHEFSGHVVQVGSAVDNLEVGQAVVVMPTTTCMRCAHCLGGLFDQCNARTTTGLTKDGAFARYVTVPARACFDLAPETDLSLAALVEPLCIGDNAADIGNIRLGDTVVILGPGTIGQTIALAAAWRGASNIIVVGLNDQARLSVAATLGATDTVDLQDEPDLKQAILRRTGQQLVDVVFEATGNPQSITDGLGVLRRSGTLVAAGIHARPVTLDLTAFVRNRQSLRAAHGSKRESWQRMIKRIQQSAHQIRPMISQELALKDALHGFDLCVKKQVSKVILRP
jgi:threonine dehydrogenase-like Zn-dependent dehydrogenase